MSAALISFIDKLQDFLANFLVSQIYLAPILLLILEELGVPLPFADVVIAYTGYQVALGRIPYFVAYLVLLVSDILGATILYLIARRYGRKVIDKFGKYIDLDQKKFTAVEEKFRKYGPVAIIIGRHIIGFKIPITLFSGISKMRYSTFAISVLISDSLWIPFYLSVGEKLGPKTLHLLHDHHWYALFFLFPIIVAILPFFLMRKNKNFNLF
ncbi:MAG: DedA family protein [Candidatus Levyibacteriota bacterium]